MSDGGKAGTVSSAMPADEPGMRILRERAELLARPMDTGTAGSGQGLYIRFRLGAREEYAVPYRFLEEILPAARPTRVPGTPPHIAGVVNRQSELLTVLDLKRLFGIAGKAGNGGGVVVATAGGVTAGIWADFIVGNDYYDRERLHAPLPSDGGMKPEYVVGIDRGTVTVLNLEALFTDAGLKVQ